VNDDFHLHCFSNDFVYNQTNSVLMETPSINTPFELTGKEFTNIGGMKIFGEEVFNDVTDLIFPKPIDSIYEKLRNGKYTSTTTEADGWQSKYSNNKLLGAVHLKYHLSDMITLVQFDGTPFEKTINNDRLTFFNYSFDIKTGTSLPVEKEYYDFTGSSTGKILDTSFYKE
jgi:hypothetical protein